MLQSTFSSKLLNLGQISTSTSPPGTEPHLPPISSLHSDFHLTCPPPPPTPQSLDTFVLARSALFVPFFGNDGPCCCL